VEGERAMPDNIASHYTGDGELADRISESLQNSGKHLDRLKTRDLAPVDEFHIRGRPATIELAEQLSLHPEAMVLDIGSGLGGPARTIAETFECNVTGIDLTPEFCETANVMSNWVALGDKVNFLQGDATALPFEDDSFDAAITIHVAMNIARKDLMYAEANRVLRSGGRFGVYDVIQGEGGDIFLPVPWARTQEISHLSTSSEVRKLLNDAGFSIISEKDSSEESLEWFKHLTRKITERDAPAVSFTQFLGSDFKKMAQNQVRNLEDRRIRTYSFICEA
jgi:ubiquinone/menaquinone biosynthesis C-methylase UbiE